MLFTQGQKKKNTAYSMSVRQYGCRKGVHVSSHSSRDISRSFVSTAENMADEHGRKWDRCIADTAVKTGQYLFIHVM